MWRLVLSETPLAPKVDWCPLLHLLRGRNILWSHTSVRYSKGKMLTPITVIGSALCNLNETFPSFVGKELRWLLLLFLGGGWFAAEAGSRRSTSEESRESQRGTSPCCFGLSLSKAGVPDLLESLPYIEHCWTGFHTTTCLRNNA